MFSPNSLIIVHTDTSVSSMEGRVLFLVLAGIILFLFVRTLFPKPAALVCQRGS